MWQALVTSWNVYKILREFRRDLEANAAKTLSDANAQAIRLKLEGLFAMLEEGRISELPKWLRWVCRLSLIDERIGTFGQHVLKSGKLETKDSVIYRCH